MRRLIFVFGIVFMLLSVSMAVQAQDSVVAQGETVYVVQYGDTLFRLALRYGTTVSAIAARNGIRNVNLIYVGQPLIIPTGGAVPTTVPPTGTVPTVTPTVVIPPTPGGETTYVVRWGDTLSRIARQFGTTINAIAVRNNILNINLIYVGQVLYIPTGGVAPTSVPPTAIPPTQTGPTPIPPTAVPGSFELGGHVFSFAYPDQMQSAGMTWAKSQIRWNRGQTASIVQGAIDAARSRNFKVLLSIVGNPAELASNPAQYIQEYADFLGSVAQLNPDAIEVWNEQNIDREWPRGLISPATYTQMLSASFAALKRVSPGVLVISGAPAPTGFFGGRCTGDGCDDDAFIRGMAAAGAASYADCIGIHYNEGVLPPDAISGDPRENPNHYTRYFPTMVSLYAGVFPNKPLCFTELGYLTADGLGPLPAGFTWAETTSIAEQAEWLARAATLSRQSGRIRMMIVWNVDSTTYGADPQAGYAIVRAGGQCLACLTLGTVMGVR
jgi:LysM repeat protein